MNLTTIGYGRSTVHDFESSDFRECCYMEATLEPWEDVDESIKVLRDRVCSKVGITEDIDALEQKRNALKQEIQRLDDTARELRGRWDKLKELNQKVGDLIGDYDPIPF